MSEEISGKDPDGANADVAASSDGAVGKKAKSKKKAKKSGKVESDRPEQLGSGKAVDTLFRNAIRAELDIINLAAMKANIMISLNGLIISALMISGAFIFASTQVFILPAMVFMLTAAGSIFFALLAASPERADAIAGLSRWLRDFVRRKARWNELRHYIDASRQETTGYEGLNLLIYEDRVRLDPAEYWIRMQELLRDRDQVYFKMADQLYWLGQMASRKFRMLDISYRIFRWGLVASVISFFGMKSLFGLFPALSGQGVVRLTNLGINEFEDIYEPSAVQQLPDGRIIVVEDEASRAISVMRMGDDGRLIENAAADQKYTRAFGRQLNDLEGLSIDTRENVYAITSHSLTGKGKRQPDREQLVRFRVRGSQIGDIASVTILRDALLRDEGLQKAVADAAGEPADFSKLNIEGLAFYRSGGQLMLGLREPRVAGLSLIVPIENPDQMFDGASPKFGEPTLLDLQGGGIRALSYDPVLSSFLIVNEIDSHTGDPMSQLWRWSGQRGALPEPVALPEIINLNNVESIDSITIHGEPRLLIMSDEGNPKKNEPARYMLLEYNQLSP
ncbi:DUF3616 domain-containing protein [Paracoccus xiamenensis]|uniref:DUF3616 domain-containing protein n=1 Tax=Paracoccus xiamenensis TaxID=2714901 RepID=UPI001407C07C|nr:DUF3616 domain-containing protein [Paracoccus xiamenensis]NHF72094.1 DUF3616 domain-containing protein [Paracoccus xiamenensis]